MSRNLLSSFVCQTDIMTENSDMIFCHCVRYSACFSIRISYILTCYSTVIASDIPKCFYRVDFNQLSYEGTGKPKLKQCLDLSAQIITTEKTLYFDKFDVMYTEEFFFRKLIYRCLENSQISNSTNKLEIFCSRMYFYNRVRYNIVEEQFYLFYSVA